MKKYTKNGKTYRQIRKDTARKLFAAGKEIALLQCNASPFSHWNTFFIMNPSEVNFDSCVNSYEWYNCNKDLGKYANFFIIE